MQNEYGPGKRCDVDHLMHCFVYFIDQRGSAWDGYKSDALAAGWRRRLHSRFGIKV